MADKKVGPCVKRCPGPGTTVDLLDPFGDNSGKVLYKFDGNALDESGNYDGTWNGTEQYQTGKFGQAAYFDNSSYIDCGQWISLIQNTNFTMSMWIYKNTNDDDTIWSTSSLISGGSLLISAGNIQFWDNSATQRITSWDDINTWVHIALTFDFPNNIMRVYRNGSLLSDLTLTSGSAVTKNSECRLGARDPNDNTNPSNYNYTGRLDQFRIIDRFITDQEAYKLYTETP